MAMGRLSWSVGVTYALYVISEVESRQIVAQITIKHVADHSTDFDLVPNLQF